VFVDRVENSMGEAMLSRDRARREAAWDKLEKEFEKAERVEGVAITCGNALAEVIAADTDLGDEDAHMLGMALTGMAQVSARYWLSRGAQIPREEAARIVGQLAWRGIGGFPKSEAGVQSSHVQSSQVKSDHLQSEPEEQPALS